MSNTEDKINELENRISNLEQLLIKNKCNDKIEQPNESAEIKPILKSIAQTLVSGDKNDLVNRINNACEYKDSENWNKWTIDDVHYYYSGSSCYSDRYDTCTSCDGYSKLLQYLSDN